MGWTTGTAAAPILTPKCATSPRIGTQRSARSPPKPSLPIPTPRSPPRSCSTRCRATIYRGHADAFATDSLARAIARGIVAKGWDQAWPDERRQFAYLPFEHSEDIADQRESLRLMNQLADPMFHDYAQKHFDIIDRFGRFPHRNDALGRTTRPEEEAAIEEGRNW